MLFLHVTTRIPDHPNDDLLGRMGGRGFPTLLYLDQNGKKIGQPMGRSVVAFERDLTNVLEKAKLATEEAQASRARAQALLAKLRFKLLKGPSGVREYLDHKRDLTEEEQQRVELYFARDSLATAVQQASGDAAERQRAVLAIFAAQARMNGRLPADELGLDARFALLQWAEANSDPLLFHNVLAEVRSVLPEVENDQAVAAETLGRLQARLDALLQ